jgi:iron only hydrogenase large subunit-like protein
MNPIFTEKTACQDCYKCLRQCPVKAITVRESSAFVDADRCITCGLCTSICPVQAKKIRGDTAAVRQLLRRGKKVILSLAPSWVTDFADVSRGELVARLKRLGFWGVSETALGAQEVSTHAAAMLESGRHRLLMSSACPVVVELVTRYHPDLAETITPLMSPALTHATLLKSWYGDDIAVVFAGPCIAKKLESDRNAKLLDAAVTFGEIRQWLDGEDAGAAGDPVSDTEFIPHQAEEGSLYPVDSGMITGIRTGRQFPPSVRFMSFSGLQAVESALEGLRELIAEGDSVFLELLACEGGCVNGPCAANRRATAGKRLRVETAAPAPSVILPRPPETSVSLDYHPRCVENRTVTIEELRAALLRIGKETVEDELNCGGCGYSTCRDFALALVEERAEPPMCVSYMRKLAMNKAAALIRVMPSGVVIVDSELRVLECNSRFPEIMGRKVKDVYDLAGTLVDASLAKLIPFASLFQKVLASGEPIENKTIRVERRILTVSIFPIEERRIVGAVIQDVTEPSVRREHIVKQAEDVIRKNMTTVQQVACLLGENAAESEVLLNSIIESFGADEE